MSTIAHEETLGFQTEVKQLLHLMIHSLYSNREIFLRELISNAADACDKLRYAALDNDGLYEGDSELRIEIEHDQEAGTVTVRDNGIGMSRDEVIQNLGTIARSGTAEFLKQLSGEQQKDARLIGQFGVGFYSSFIVADEVTVRTRKAGSDKSEGVEWRSRGEGEFTVADVENERHGTEIVLHLKSDAKEFADEFRLKGLVRKYSDHIEVPVRMPRVETAKDDDGKEIEAVRSPPGRPSTRPPHSGHAPRVRSPTTNTRRSTSMSPMTSAIRWPGATTRSRASSNIPACSTCRGVHPSTSMSGMVPVA
ncbi:hypothetical protein Q427_33680 [Halomonas sp. BC04]|nr:hypothetical protein Q427_33680 [Halomonas sp. BC04]